MNQAEEFFTDLKDWSIRKLNIIEKYIGGFSKILGSKHREVFYVDGFAGRGIYDKGEKGSPVLAAEVSQGFQQKKVPFTLKCINVEKDPDNFSNLDNETRRFGGLVENLSGTFEENIDSILQKTRGNPAVFFIDDFGIKGTGWETVEKVITRKDSTDIWIRFDYKTVRRLAGFYDSDAKDAQGKLTTLQNLFGITDKNYLQSKLDGNTPEQRVNNAVDFYIEQLEKTFIKFGKKDGFAASYPIISVDGQRKYHLVFACAHQKAATLASNIVNGVEETFQREKEEFKEITTGQMSFFTTDISESHIFDEKVKNLKKAILLAPKKKAMSREDVLFSVISRDKNWFGKIGRRHLTQAIKELSNSSAIKCDGTPGSDDAVITILE